MVFMAFRDCCQSSPSSCPPLAVMPAQTTECHDVPTELDDVECRRPVLDLFRWLEQRWELFGCSFVYEDWLGRYGVPCALVAV